MYTYEPNAAREWRTSAMDSALHSPLTYAEVTKNEWRTSQEPDWQRFHRSIDRLLEIVEAQDEKIRCLEMRIGLCDKAETKLHEDLEQHKATDLERHGWAGGSISELKPWKDWVGKEITEIMGALARHSETTRVNGDAVVELSERVDQLGYGLGIVEREIEKVHFGLSHVAAKIEV